jgi:ribosomal protein L11 methyltransferase
MAKLGANVLALDNDSIAVQATQDAVRRNGVEQQVTVREGAWDREAT